ncbi:hypothetical protein BIW11_02309 [Tropilaelaps mercedesae]|uniref:Galactosyltransferase C-terminal domain-containing protein n=1 Tax=Tropilaelaps mercedesae TaxID=418985 RepID=A0A1V9WZG9_9ACAR|nr:hypothetical protein BIW11_02309 [Tropilaelaps mercedesae]
MAGRLLLLHFPRRRLHPEGRPQPLHLPPLSIVVDTVQYTLPYPDLFGVCALSKQTMQTLNGFSNGFRMGSGGEVNDMATPRTSDLPVAV